MVAPDKPEGREAAVCANPSRDYVVSELRRHARECRAQADMLTDVVAHIRQQLRDVAVEFDRAADLLQPAPAAPPPAAPPEETSESGEGFDAAYWPADPSVAPASPPEIPEHVAAVMGRLRRWANRLRGRYGVPIYLCGSALRADNPDPRDWDIRIMLPDDRFALAFGPVDEWRAEGCTGNWTRTRFRWSDQCVKDTKDFAAWCHLNGDVQIYPESHAATLYANEPRLRLDTFPDCAWEDSYDSAPIAAAPSEARENDHAIAEAARRFFDDFVQHRPDRSYPWMPLDLITALVEDYDRRHAEVTR